MPPVLRRFRMHYRQFHHHHGKRLAHVGKVGIFGEMAYHFAEVNGMHHGVIGAAIVLLVIQAIRVVCGQLD